MWKVIRNSLASPDLRKRLIYTFMIVIVFRIGSIVVAPFIDTSTLIEMTASNAGFQFLSMMSGGAFDQATIFALGIGPYINASIIMQLMTVAIPALERMAKEGPEGRKKINRITRYVTVSLALIQAIGYYTMVRFTFEAIPTKYLEHSFTTWFTAITIVLTFTAGAALVMWLGEQISDKGIGNGISILLFVGIISRGPAAVTRLYETFKDGSLNYLLVPMILFIFLFMIVIIVIMNRAERRIPIQYAKRMVGRKMYGGQSSFIPVKVSMSGVLPIIFATAFLSLPQTIQMFWTPEADTFWAKFFQAISPQGWIYAVTYFFLIIAFNYFYVSIQYNPVEIANNIKSNNGAIPGIRPGKPTVAFITKVISKITLVGAFFLAFIAIFPIVFSAATSINVFLGGTSIIIVVGVALDTMRQMESQMTMRHHRGFLE